MAKKESVKDPKAQASKAAEIALSTTVDSKLADLFSSSLPRTAPSLSKQERNRLKRGTIPAKDVQHGEDELSVTGDNLDNQSASSEDGGVELPIAESPSKSSRSRKRKRGEREDELEGRYMQKLALEEQRETVSRKKLRKDSLRSSTPADGKSQSKYHETGAESSTSDATGSKLEVEDEDDYDVPIHESLMPDNTAQEIDKAARTVFLGNVSTLAIKSKQAKKILQDHLSSFFGKMKASEGQSLESIRFRSIAFSDGSIPKKAAFARQDLMDATTQSMNAYAVYSTTSAAREASKYLNGTIVLDRHLRVDSVAHPSPIDHRRCVFVGNLGFVDDESNIRANEQEEGKQRPKPKVPADVEEGLWVHFAKAGPVESVRVVRDRNTRVGKGIAYVQFKDPNSVEKALSFSDKKFPPMLPRKLRVTRARKLKKSTMNGKPKTTKFASNSTSPRKQSAQLSSLTGRANRLFGRAGGHHVRKQSKPGGTQFKSPEDVVFEGHRAVPKTGGSKKGKTLTKKKRDRRTNRSAAYRQ